MEARELKIGNWINKAEGRTEWDCQINGKDIQDFEHSCASLTTHLYRTWRPIPLTAEWLTRFGFKANRSQVSLNVGGELQFYWMNSKKIFWCVGETHLTLDNVLKHDSHKFQYVHQLQNLYFALTGEELELETVKEKR